MMKRILIILMALFLNSCSLFSKEKNLFQNPDIEKLDNGLHVVWFLDDSLPLIYYSMIIEGGYKMDPPAHSGTLKLVESLLDRGVKDLSAFELAKGIEDLSASKGIGTGGDYQFVDISGFYFDYKKLLFYLKKMIREPIFSESEVILQKKRLIESILQSKESVKDIGEFYFKRLLQGGTVYSKSQFTSLDELAGITRDDIIKLHRSVFVPNKSWLLVVGRGNKKLIKKEILNQFSDWKEDTKKIEPTIQDPEWLKGTKSNILIVDKPGQTQSYVFVGQRAPKKEEVNTYALEIFNSTLGGSFTSRLMQDLREKKGLTYGIGSQIVYNKEHSLFYVSSFTQTVTTGELLKNILEHLSKIQREGCTAEEIQFSKKYLIGAFPVYLNKIEEIANKWLFSYLDGYGENYLNFYPENIEKIELEKLNFEIKKYLNIDQLKIVISGDAKKIKLSLIKNGFSEFSVIPYSDIFK